MENNQEEQVQTLDDFFDRNSKINAAVSKNYVDKRKKKNSLSLKKTLSIVFVLMMLAGIILPIANILFN
ncbi:hypothetical protein [Weissella muntiaci]|uniref:hypothetical protein n=1 Tax=Weissella muntiaci TaxID=2508881 RepID=UPI0011DFAB1F|nr:hypothetical protein [Weissella muntiaci]